MISALGLGLFAFDLLALSGVDPALQRPGANVVQAMALGFPAQLLLGASSYFLEGISRPQRVMAVNLTMLPFNGMLRLGMGRRPFRPAGARRGRRGLCDGDHFRLGALAMILTVWRLPHAVERRVRDW